MSLTRQPILLGTLSAVHQGLRARGTDKRGARVSWPHRSVTPGRVPALTGENSPAASVAPLNATRCSEHRGASGEARGQLEQDGRRPWRTAATALRGHGESGHGGAG